MNGEERRGGFLCHQEMFRNDQVLAMTVKSLLVHGCLVVGKGTGHHVLMICQEVMEPGLWHRPYGKNHEQGKGNQLDMNSLFLHQGPWKAGAKLGQHFQRNCRQMKGGSNGE